MFYSIPGNLGSKEPAPNTRGVDPFFGCGGGGGKNKDNFKIFGALRNVSFARRARRKIKKLCMFSSRPIFMLNWMVL